MTTTATNLATASRLFHALSDETRLEIMTLLADGERCVCELTSALDAAQSRLSFHLRTLKDAGLVTDRRDGRWVYYAINADAVAEATSLLGGFEPRSRPGAGGGSCCG